MENIKKHIVIILSWLAIYLSPTLEFLLTVGFFVLADTITGVAAAIKINDPITSKKFRACIPKYVVYGTAVIIAHVLQKEFFMDFPAMKLIAGLIAYSELMSIDENIKKISGISLFKFFIDKLGKLKK